VCAHTGEAGRPRRSTLSLENTDRAVYITLRPLPMGAGGWGWGRADRSKACNLGAGLWLESAVPLSSSENPQCTLCQGLAEIVHPVDRRVSDG
jgi:hypothetical protein